MLTFSITDDATEKAKEIRSKQGHPEDWVLRVGLRGECCFSGCMHCPYGDKK